MITASHNPPGDNGYKLYLDDGAQIVPPADTDIEAAIEVVGPLADIPVAAPDSPLITRYGNDSTQAYLDAIISELGHAPASAAWLRFVYTPLHGVAGSLALRAFEQAGFAAPDIVDAQFAPDPDFPTVRFPNPEEPGALDLAIARARRSGADLIIANDPDGDRLAVAIPDAGAAGGYRQLTGDQVGALLGAFLLRRLAADTGTDISRQLVVSTVVSGSLLGKIAAAAGAQHAQTLTGFKWIVRAADRRDGVRFAFGYEEALGYAVTSAVRDKDGISAALAVLSLAADAWSAGESLQDAYDALEIQHGVHLTAQVTLPTEATVHVMSRLRAAPPVLLADDPVTHVTDYSGGTWELPSADMLSYKLPGARVVVRPSGTEPKIKAYLEVVEGVTGRTLAMARATAAARMDRLRASVTELLD
jgi:phosphomannomutase